MILGNTDAICDGGLHLFFILTISSIDSILKLEISILDNWMQEEGSQCVIKKENGLHSGF